jgi:hypothetical protein
MPGPAMVADGASIPAPIEGWDAVSPIAAMSPKRAVRLDNWFPQPGWVEIRKGHKAHANTATGNPVETVAAYQGVSSDKMFAAVDDSIYDVTDENAGPATAVVTGLQNARWQKINFTTTGGHFLYMVNGADVPQYYNGTAWAAATITGITPTDIIGVNAHKNRLWFTLKNSTAAAYLPLDSIQGAATTFELGGLFTLGGYLMAMATWSVDAGTGPQDYAVFISSRGQTAVYQGTDPSSSTTWTLVNVYDLGPPIGRRCFFKVGSDVAIISIDGVLPLSKAMIFERAADIKATMTQRIQRVMSESARQYKDNFGWQLISYPRGTRAILNVPITEGVNQQQYVMNTLNGAWCRFIGMNANCWEIFNDKPFFGGNDGIVYEADTTGTDVDTTLVADMETAFNYHGSRGRQKRWMMCRPLLTTDNEVTPGLALNTDFKRNAPISTPTVVASVQATWDVSLWDSGAVWVGEVSTEAVWTSVTGLGYCESIRMVVSLVSPDAGNGAVWGAGLWGINTWGHLAGPEVTLQVNGFDLTMEQGAFV